MPETSESPGFPYQFGRLLVDRTCEASVRCAGPAGKRERAPGRTPEGITTRIAPRAAFAVATTLLLLAGSATVAQAHPTAANAAPTPRAASAAVHDLLVERAHRAAQPAARRIVAQPTARLTAAQRRAATNNARRAAVVRFALAQRGKWYQHGADGLRRYDCSGLTKRALAQAGVRLPHSSRLQRTRGVRVSSRDARPGDIVSYRGHAGVLSGKWQMVAAPGRGRRVQSQTVYKRADLQFRRVIG